MRKTFGLVAILALLLPGLGFSDGVSIRLGYFIPQAKGDLWQIEFENMSYNKSNFQTVVLGFTYEHFLTREISLSIGFDSYSKIERGYYRDYVGYGFTDIGDFGFPADIRPEGYDTNFDISHQLNISMLPIQASLKITPLGRKSGIMPYVGGGVSLYFWSVKLQGDMIDFTDVWTYDTGSSIIDVYGVRMTDAREENQLTLGFHGFAGLMIPIARRAAVEAEFKYNYGKGTLKDAFEGFGKFDLSGYQISLGINYWF
jgi:opacity protein-like surface antigen